MDIKGTYKAGLIAPLHSWDVFSSHLGALSQEGSKKCDRDQLLNFQEKFTWSVDVTALLSSEYEALVLTDKSIRIRWVNRGFQLMTGYSLKEVQRRSPSMLQGENTSNASKAFIRDHLFTQDSFTTEVINYRKSGEEYRCRVTIHPLLDQNEKLSHFLALETKIR